MKIFKLSVLWFSLLASTAYAQSPKAVLESNINTQIKANGQGLITGPILNSVLINGTVSMATYLGAWSSVINYNGGEIVTLDGVLYLSLIPSLNASPATSPTSWLATSIGYPLTLSNPSALATATIASGVNSIHIQNVSGSFPPTAGIGTCGLTYTIGTTTPTGIYGEILNSASGIYWEPNYSNSPVKACEFGAIGDGVYNATTGFPTGTDNTPMIQAAFNYALQNRYGSVCLNDGRYKTTDTLQQGWGDSYYSLSFVGCNLGREPYYELAGPEILPTMTDRCALNLQGARLDAVRGISFLGANYPHNSTITAPYPVTAAGWLDPLLAKTGTNPGGLQQHSPYAAICIDAYSGTAPADAYPNVTYPAWTGIGSVQYNKALGSDIEITNVEIVGFAVDINSKPNGDGNGDFVKVDKVTCDYSVYCLSIGNTQSRNVQFTNINGALDFDLITNNQFGLRSGVLTGPIDNLSCGQCYEYFQVDDLTSLLFQVSHLYGESVVRLGSIASAASFPNSASINGCTIGTYDNLTGVIPAAIIEAGALSISLKDCDFNGSTRFNTLVHGAASVSIDGGVFQGGATLGSVFDLAGIQQANNYTGSMFIGSAMTFPLFPDFSQLTWVNPTYAYYMVSPNSGPYQNQQLMGPYASNGVRQQFTQATKGFVDQPNNRRWDFAMGPTGALINLALTGDGYVSIPAAISSCDTMTFTYIANFQATDLQSYNINIGDILYHHNTGTLFVITAIGATDGSGNYPITTRQMNNMNVNSSGVCTLNNLVAVDPNVSGNIDLIHTGVLNIPTVPYFGTFTSGSTAVTNVQSGNGNGAALAVYMAAGDRMWAYPIQDAYFQWPYPPGGTLATLTPGSPGSLTLSANATVSGRFPILPLPVVGGPQ